MATKPNTAPTPTPENTPIPGGGSWRWAGTGWLSRPRIALSSLFTPP